MDVSNFMFKIKEMNLYKTTDRFLNNYNYIKKTLNREPTIEEICSSLNVSEKMAQASLNSIKMRYLVSLDKEIGYQDGGTRTVGEMIPDNYHIAMEEAMDNKVLRTVISDCFKTLTKREEQVIRLRFGITDNLDETEIFEIKE